MKRSIEIIKSSYPWSIRKRLAEHTGYYFRMKEFDIDKQDGSVVFGQVDGMGDQVSYALGISFMFSW